MENEQKIEFLTNDSRKKQMLLELHDLQTEINDKIRAFYEEYKQDFPIIIIRSFRDPQNNY